MRNDMEGWGYLESLTDITIYTSGILLPFP